MNIYDIYNIETAVQYLARLYMMNDTSIDIVRDVLLWIHDCCNQNNKRVVLCNLLKSLQLDKDEIDKIVSVL